MDSALASSYNGGPAVASGTLLPLWPILRSTLVHRVKLACNRMETCCLNASHPGAALMARRYSNSLSNQVDCWILTFRVLSSASLWRSPTL